MYSNETYTKFSVGGHLADNFPIQNGLKEGDVLLQLLSNFCFRISY
jgi:hypothetical protein